MLMTEIQSATTRPERCVVAHPYNPPHIVPCVEIVPGEATSTETVALTRDFMALMGRTPVVARKECRGHIVNHMQALLYREAMWLVGNGGSDSRGDRSRFPHWSRLASSADGALYGGHAHQSRWLARYHGGKKARSQRRR